MNEEQQQQQRHDGPGRAEGNASVILSTYKIYRFRPFTMTITLGAQLAARFTADDVLRAGLGTKCCLEQDVSVDVGSCQCCGGSTGRRTVEIGISSHQVFGPHRNPDGTFSFSFDQCRSNCSSSRDHHRGRLVLVIDELSRCGPIISPPFTLNAREKHRKPSRPPSLRRQPAEAAQVQQAPQETTTTSEGSAKHREANELGWRIVPVADKPVSIVTVPKEVSGSFLPSSMFIRVFTTTYTATQMELLEHHFSPFIRSLPGFMDFRCRAFPGFVISFSTFRTPEEANNTVDVVSNYVANRDGFKNPLNTDLSAIGVAILIATCTSY